MLESECLGVFRSRSIHIHSSCGLRLDRQEGSTGGLVL